MRARLALVRRALLEAAEAVEPEALEWSPEDGVPSIAQHLVEVWRVDQDLASILAGMGASAGARRPARARRPGTGQLVATLRTARASLDAWFAAADDAVLDAPALEGGSTLRAELEAAGRADVHHRAQILLLAKLMDPARPLCAAP